MAASDDDEFWDITLHVRVDDALSGIAHCRRLLEAANADIRRQTRDPLVNERIRNQLVKHNEDRLAVLATYEAALAKPDHSTPFAAKLSWIESFLAKWHHRELFIDTSRAEDETGVPVPETIPEPLP